MKILRLTLLPAALLFLIFPAGAAAPGDKVFRVLLVSDGQTEGPGGTSVELKQILTDSGHFEVRVFETPEELSGATLEQIDLVVLNTALEPRGETEQLLSAWVATGKGLLIARDGLGVSETPGHWPLSVGSGVSTPARFLDVRWASAAQPIARGMDDPIRTVDGLPPTLRLRPEAEAIATIAIDGTVLPVVATASKGQGRIVGLALGANAGALQGPPIRALVSRAAEWAASGAVTLPAILGRPGPPPGAIRGLLITGGHEHEVGFYSLFAQNSDTDWLIVDTAANAFKKDIRDRYDVVIMYDFTRDLDDDARSHLRAFVESGKGIVVLHHALLNYQTWTWWSEEVVGGRYRLQTEGKFPSSGVRDNQTMEMTPACEHPVLKGIGPFQIVDEAYKNMFQSPRIKPLLVTNHPASDSTLAWIGPTDSFRVIAIQLGHGHTAFGHPDYRALVHNAVLWAAGRNP